MNFEFYIAKRLKTNKADGESNKSTPSLSIAVFGITLAITIMILSITIVCGFKSEISNKIYNLDSHIKIRPVNVHFGEYEIGNEINNDVVNTITGFTDNEIKNIGLIAEKSAILKTGDDFKGVVYKGVDDNYDWKYINSSLIDGRIPNLNDTADISEILISKIIANRLQLSVDDKIFTYFIDEKVKVRKSRVVGIFNTDLEDFDNNYIIGNIRQIQSVNNWDANTGNYIEVNCNKVADIEDFADVLHRKLNPPSDNLRYHVTSTTKVNTSYFTWLQLLDMNVVIIIIIMLLVSSFTLISAMLMIVLERINMIGILKTMGAGNNSIRKIFIYLTNKLILKSMLLGNLIGLSVAYIQQEYHIIKLNAEAYYISFVPVEINWWYILALNVVILAVAYLSLLGPSHIVSKIEPNKSVKFE